MLLQHAEINQDFRRKKKLNPNWRNSFKTGGETNEIKVLITIMTLLLKIACALRSMIFFKQLGLKLIYKITPLKKSSKTALKSHNKRSDLTAKKLYVFFIYNIIIIS